MFLGMMSTRISSGSFSRRFAGDRFGVEIRVVQQRGRRRLRVGTAAADCGDALVGFDHVAVPADDHEMLGIPDDDRDDFRSWSQVILSSTATMEEFRAAGGSMYAYFMSLLAAISLVVVYKALIGRRGRTV